MEDTKVLQFKNPALFGPKVRVRLESALAPTTETPAAVIDTVEQALCTHIVACARDFFTKWATKAGTNLGRRISGV
jgi:hypothetical protein